MTSPERSPGWRPALTLLALLALSLAAVGPSRALQANDPSGWAAGPPSAALAPHAPIRIESDAAFNASNGVVAGNGSASSPYIISGWTIQRNGTTHGILVANTTKRFAVRDVEVTGGDQKGDGVRLVDLGNATLSNLTLANHSAGISLLRAPDVVVRNITASSSLFGIHADASDRLTVAEAHTTGAGQKGDGVHLRDLADAAVSDSTMDDQASGINLQRAHRTTVSNITTRASANGVLAEHSHLASIERSRFDASIQYAVLLSFSNDSAIRNSTFTMVSEAGVLYDATYRFRVENSTFTGGRAGLELSASQIGFVWNNTFKDISGDGMLIQSASSNTISRNRFVNDSVAILALISFYNTLEDNTVEGCYNGWVFDNVFSSKLRRNRVANSSLYGLQMATSGLNTLENNTLLGNYYDFDLRPDWKFPETMENRIDLTNIVTSGKVFVATDLKDPKVPPGAGYVGLGNVSGTLAGLNLSRQGQGVLVAFSTSLTLSDSRFASNAQGVSVVGSSNITLRNITVSDAHEAGVFIHGTRDSTLTGVRVLGSNLSGMEVWESARNLVERSEVAGTKLGPGIRIDSDSHENRFTRNVVRDSKSLGMEMGDRTQGNIVWWNDFLGNKKHADDLGAALRNLWNGSDRGNYWEGHNATDADCDGVLDLFYIIGTRGSRDFKPQVKSISAAVKPCHPEGLKAKVAGQQVTLAWKAPAFDGDSPVTGYSVHRRLAGGAPTKVGTSPTASFVDQAPEANLTYLYSVSAMNSEGEGPRSAEAEAATTWIPPKMPDGAALVVAMEPSEATAGDRVRLRGAVANLGSLEIESAKARLLLGGAATGTELARADVAGLAPGERLDLIADWTAAAGPHLFTLVVEEVIPRDPDGANNEIILAVQIAEKGGGEGGPDTPPRAPWSPMLAGAAAALMLLAIALAAIMLRGRRAAAPTDEKPEGSPAPAAEKVEGSKLPEVTEESESSAKSEPASPQGEEKGG